MTVQPALPPVPGKRSANAFITWLHQQLGKPYVLGGTGPNSYDCSGLVYAGLKAIGFSSPPRTSEDQWAAFPHINRSQLKPGDLVFSQWPGDDASPGHVQVYIGGGKVLQSPEPGQKVDIVPLSGDSGHIVGYARVPGMGGQVLPGSVPAGSGGAALGGQLGGILAEAGDLLHGVAEILDFVFGFFAPGNGWRLAFGAGAAVSGYGAVKTYSAGSGSAGGANFPLAVGLAGIATLSAFMALRPWPVESDAPERPGKYAAEILSGQPPPPGPARVHETDTIEAGLAVFATAYLASKAASSISGVIGGISAFLAGLGGSAAE
jgi:NlpC/P60 family